MEVTNAFKEIVNVTENKWYEFADLALIFGYHIKLSGLNWKTNHELVDMMGIAWKMGFLKVDMTSPNMVKIEDHWYEYKST